MKNLKIGMGVIKEFDNLGRLVIPKEMRTLFSFSREVEVVITNEGVLIRNPQYVLVKKDDIENNKSDL